MHAVLSDDEVNCLPLVRGLPRNICRRKSYFAPSKYLTSQQLKQSFKSNGDLSSYLQFCRNLEHQPDKKLIMVNNIEQQLHSGPPPGKETNKFKPNSVRQNTLRQVYCQGWFADRTQMTFKMNEYFTANRHTEGSVESIKAPARPRQHSFSLHKSNRAKCARQLVNSFEMPRVYESQKSDKDLIRDSFNRMITQINREVSREQREAIQANIDTLNIKPPLCRIGNTQQDMEKLCERSNINLTKLKSLLRKTKYKSKMDTLIGMLKE